MIVLDNKGNMMNHGNNNHEEMQDMDMAAPEVRAEVNEELASIEIPDSLVDDVPVEEK